MKDKYWDKRKPKFFIDGDQWNDETMENIVELLHEYQDLFPSTFREMKGIVCELGEMKIHLKLGPKIVRQRAYRLNLKYKEKVKVEIDQMLEERIFKPIVESKWISPW
jgi:hypothetical protein